MKKKVSPFKLGLFALSGLTVILGALVWIGATHLFQKTKTYVTFFDYSVRGLKSGTGVEHLGIKIGRVTSISLMKNGQLVQVLMEIERGYDVGKNQAVEIKMGGLTGGNYLALVPAPENLKEVTPKIDFPTKYPVLPSAKGTIARIESALEDIFKKFNDSSSQGGALSAWTDVGTKANKILSNKDIDETLSNLKSASASLNTILGDIGRPGNVGDINKVIENLATASSSIRAAGVSINQQIEALPPNSLATVAQRMEKSAKVTEQAVGSMSTQMEQTLSVFQQSARQINQVLSELEALAQSLREEPGRIFKQPGGSEPFGR